MSNHFPGISRRACEVTGASTRRHWLLLFAWLLGSLAVLGAFEYQAALRGLICGG
jgi:hypothetical protein